MNADAEALLEQAARLDAVGNHAQAIDMLARAAKANHAPALRLLGIRLSTGQNAPGLPVEGAGLIRAAAGRGDGPALSLLAVFAAVGYLQPQDWAQAFAHLRAAADTGWQPARDQWALIEGGAADISVWRRLPESDLISASPRIVRFEELVSAAICDALIGMARDRLVRARVFDPITGQPIVEKTRTNRLASLPLFESSLLSILVQERLAAAASVSSRQLEAAAILNYRPGEQSRPHFDFIDPKARGFAAEMQQIGQRVATVLVYLNDDYTGGETAFPELGIDHRGKKGDALLFVSVDGEGQPDRRTVHAGRPPLNGEKWVLSQFIRSKPRP
jgi:hypothetical protein